MTRGTVLPKKKEVKTTSPPQRFRFASMGAICVQTSSHSSLIQLVFCVLYLFFYTHFPVQSNKNGIRRGDEEVGDGVDD